ncbi:MAG: CYTH domain-containing protein [Aliidongia sp.]
MPVEIERKFLVRDARWRGSAAALPLRQGYLTAGPDVSVRIRRAGGAGFITVKSGVGLVRAEYEYPIPPADADEMLDTLCARPLIEKHRHEVEFAGLVWVVDKFDGALAGLVLAEIELEHAAQEVPLPPWIGREVTGDPRYLNANLAKFGLPPEF